MPLESLKAVNLIKGNLSHIGSQTSLDYKYDRRIKQMPRQMSYVYVFDKIPRVEIPSDIYLNNEGEGIRAKYSAGSPLIEFFQAKENKEKKRYKKEKEEAELKERFYQYKQERLKICKNKNKHSQGGEIGRYSPNYNAIFSNVYSVKISRPSYQEEMQKKIQAKIDKVNEKREKEKEDKDKEKEIRQTKKQAATARYHYVKLERDETPIKPKNKLLKKRNKEITKVNDETDSLLGKSIVKRNKQMSQSNYFPNVRGIDFDKLSGRNNAITNRRKQAEITVNYNPKYDSISADTTKTFVHYESRETLGLRKWRMTMKAIHNYKIEHGYKVMQINEKEKENERLRQEAQKSVYEEDVRLLGLS